MSKTPPVTSAANSRTRTMRNLNFLRGRHAVTGMDCDYFEKLSDDDLTFMENFSRRYYDGHPDQPAEAKKEANRRRYRAKEADAQPGATTLHDAYRSDEVSSERKLEAAEQLEEELQPRVDALTLPQRRKLGALIAASDTGGFSFLDKLRFIKEAMDDLDG